MEELCVGTPDPPDTERGRTRTYARAHTHTHANTRSLSFSDWLSGSPGFGPSRIGAVGAGDDVTALMAPPPLSLSLSLLSPGTWASLVPFQVSNATPILPASVHQNYSINIIGEPLVPAEGGN